MARVPGSHMGNYCGVHINHITIMIADGQIGNKVLHKNSRNSNT